VDPEDVPDYYQVIARPMDLDTMRVKVDQGLYATKDEFRDDVLLIHRNAREYNPCGPQVRGVASVWRVCSICLWMCLS
jgi:bromodomain adjacent to zinc finger domain protein 1B